MQFLKENKRLLYIVVILPLFFFYLDKTIILWMRDFHKGNFKIYPFLESIDPLINFISHGSTLIIIALILYVSGRYLNQKFYHAGRSMFIGFISSGILVQVLKHLIGRARPRITDDLLLSGPSLKGGYDSFPSGHTTVVFCLAYILSQHFPKYRFLFYIFAFMVGFERVKYLSHFPSDVLAGAIIGIAVGRLLSVRILHLEGQQYDRNN